MLQQGQVYAFGFKGEDKLVTVRQHIASGDTAKDNPDASKWRRLGFQLSDQSESASSGVVFYKKSL